MPKNVVVCCDGTANEFTRDRTNVVKLFRALVKDPHVQVCYYHPGVGTTASSVGWFTSPISLPYTASNPDIAIGRHAVSIDEHRAFFRTNLWRPSSDPAEAGPKDLKQVWFPGVHCDIGGGYKECES